MKTPQTAELGAGKTDSFDNWMKRLDKIIARNWAGLTSDDLIDWSYMDAYEDGLTPSEAYATMVEEGCFE